MHILTMKKKNSNFFYFFFILKRLAKSEKFEEKNVFFLPGSRACFTAGENIHHLQPGQGPFQDFQADLPMVKNRPEKRV